VRQPCTYGCGLGLTAPPHIPAAALKPGDARQISICAAAAAGDLDLVKCYISGTHGQAHSRALLQPCDALLQPCDALPAGLPVTDINSVDDDGMTPLHHAAL
jgi:hypothetical protein